MQKSNLWVGIGCQKGSSRQLIETAIQEVFTENQLEQSAIAGIATIDHKASEIGLVEFCRLRNLPLKTFSVESLSSVFVPNPAKTVEKEVGTPSVAEAAAILAASKRLFIKYLFILALATRSRGHTDKTLRSSLVRAGRLSLCSSELYSPKTFKTFSNISSSSMRKHGLEVKLLIPKQIFRLAGEPQAVTIAVARELFFLTKSL
ncbi:MAG: cobalamin biosynthesis protein [Nodularia sp. CChRGM 3473]